MNNTVTTFSPLKDGDELAFLGYSCRVFHLDQKLAILEGCTEPYRGQLWGIDDEVPVTAVNAPLTSLKGMVAASGKPVSLEAMDQAIRNRARPR